MVTEFARYISALSPSHKNNSQAVRSASLPSPSHPFIAHLEEQVRTIQAWTANKDVSMARIESGLTHIELLQTALEEFLRLSQIQETLIRSCSTEGFLDDFLLLADVYGSFRSAMVNLRQNQSDLRSAIRRGDKISLTAGLRSLRRVQKEISQLASSLKGMTKCRLVGACSNALERGIIGIMIEVISATSAASMAVFTGTVVMSVSSSLTKNTSSLQLFKKLSTFNSASKIGVCDEDSVAMDKLEELEGCMENVEDRSEQVLRSLLKLRVLLLNISTPSL